MLNIFSKSRKIKELLLKNVNTPEFNCYFMQKRWKKPAVTAQTRLEDRTRDLKLDKLMGHFKKLKIVHKMFEIMCKRRGPFVSLQLLSRWRNIVGLKIGIGVFLAKYPHIFEISTHPVKKKLRCRFTDNWVTLVREETDAIKEYEPVVVRNLKKLLMISANESLHIHALWLIRRELGLPDDFRESILLRYPNEFHIVNTEIVALVARDESLAIAEIEKWREKEYNEKWLSEFETRYAFQINFPTGFKIEKGFKEKLKNWQRLPYLNPYEKKEVRVRTCGGSERFQKRVVGILHEFLCLTVEKMIEIERLAHFRKDLRMEVNVRELLLNHPGIFYISTKGSTQTVFLREAYHKGCLLEPNPVYTIRRKMLSLLLVGDRNTRALRSDQEIVEEENVARNEEGRGACDGDWVIPILSSVSNQGCNESFVDINGSSNEN